MTVFSGISCSYPAITNASFFFCQGRTRYRHTEKRRASWPVPPTPNSPKDLPMNRFTTTFVAAALLMSVLGVANAGVPGFNPGLPDGEPQDQPLLTKGTFSGFVMNGFQRPQICDVYADKVVITKGYGLISVKETVAIEIEGDIQSIIDAASEEQLTEEGAAACDGPSTHISAGNTVLYSTGGCGSKKQVRDGVNTKALIDMVGAYCPRTI